MASLLDRVEIPDIPDDLSAEFSPDFSDQLEHDLPSAAFPAEAPMVAGGRKAVAKLRPSGATLSAAMRKRVSAELRLYLELVVGVGEMYCEPCAAVWSEHLERIAERGTAVMALYPDLAAKFIGTGAIPVVIGLAAALREPVRQMVRHHVTRTLSYEDEQDQGVDYGNLPPYRPVP